MADYKDYANPQQGSLDQNFSHPGPGPDGGPGLDPMTQDYPAGMTRQGREAKRISRIVRPNLKEE